MGRIKVTSSQTATGWTPLPRGTYDFEIESVEEKQTSNGNPQLVIKMIVLSGEYSGKKATHFLVITEKSGGFVREFVEAANIDAEITQLDEISEEDGKPLIDIDFDSDDLVGAQVRADAIVTQYNGQDQNKFQKFRPITAEEAQPRQTKTSTPSRTAQSGQRQPAKAAQGRTAPAGNQTRRSRI